VLDFLTHTPPDYVNVHRESRRLTLVPRATCREGTVAGPWRRGRTFRFLTTSGLSVVVLEYGLNRVSAGGPTGSPGGPLPTGLSSYESMVGFLDPVTGEGGYGADYPEPLPPISTTPATG